MVSINKNKGFTILELLIVIAIIGILSSIIFPSINNVKNKAYFSRTNSEYKSMAIALEMYSDDNNGEYPPDANRNIPPGLEDYLVVDADTGEWPQAPWPGSIYDWENWQDPEDATERIYQISVRFCPIGGTIEECNFPNMDWAEDFGVNSSVYYCIEGNCRSHINEPIDYPGYCVNC